MFQSEKDFQIAIFTQIQLSNFFSPQQCPCEKRWTLRASGVFRDVWLEEPPYHTAEELWEGLKQGDEGARLLFVFFLRLR